MLTRRAPAEGVLVGGLHRGCGFLTLPAEFAGPATPHRQLKRYLEGLTTRIGRPESVVYRSLYYIITATFRATVFVHYALLRIAPNVRNLLS